MTLEESLALAILRGDRYAARGLVDALQEEWARTETLDEQAKRERESSPLAFDSHTVWMWPEFQALCRRLGILWNLNTIDLTIRLPVGATVIIEQTYRGIDTQAERG